RDPHVGRCLPQAVVGQSPQRRLFAESPISLVHEKSVGLAVVGNKDVRPAVAVKSAQTTPRPGPGDFPRPEARVRSSKRTRPCFEPGIRPRLRNKRVTEPTNALGWQKSASSPRCPHLRVGSYSR